MKTKNILIALVILLTFFNSSYSQIIYTIAGTGLNGYNGDGISAASAQVAYPHGIATDTAGNVYISDQINNRIRKISPSGVITTVVGTGVSGFSGDGGLAINAKISTPYDVAVDRAGNIYIADFGNKRVRKVTAAGIISTVAGTGVNGYNGDGILGTTAQLNSAYSVTADSVGNTYIGDVANNRIRKVDVVTGIITTFAGTGVQGSSPNGIATSSKIYGPGRMAFDKTGNMFFSDAGNNVVRKIDPSGMMTLFAGNGATSFAGDGGQALSASLNSPNGIAVDANGNVYISDMYHYRIRKVNTSGIITTIAGNGTNGSYGDGGLATSAAIVFTSIAVDKYGSIVGTENTGHKIRKIVYPCVTPNPPTSTTPTTALNVCIGKSITLSVLDPGLISWYPTSVSTTTLGTGFTFTTPAITTNTVFYAETRTCTGSTTRTSFSITASPNPTVSVGPNSPVCIGSSITLSGTGATSYTWTGGISDGVSFSPTVTTTYTVNGSDANNCTSSAIITVTVNPIPIISVNSGSICIGETFTIIPSGAISYSYSGGSAVVNPTTDITYTITGSDVIGCIANALSSVTVNALPNLIFGSVGTLCEGSSTTISVSGADAYLWSTGAQTASVTVTPTITTTYTVVGTNLNSCSNTQTLNLTVDPNCQDVWPGDANSDGMTDNLDVLELGLHFTQTGSPRASTSNTWQSYFANNWTGTITSGKNLNHSDCNGDGMIDDNDTLAIYNNYGLSHSFKTAQTTTVNPQLNVVPDQASVVKGTWGTASIYLGDATNSINNLNGVAFTLDFDNSLIETNNIYIVYQNSFLDAGQNLYFRKLDFPSGKIFTATTHTVNNNVSGYGKIATLHYQIKSSLTSDQVLNLGIIQANQSDASGTIVPLTSGTGTLMALGSSVGLQELNGNSISISPNPTNGSLTINSKTELQKIEIVSITGQLLLTEFPTNVSHTLHLEDLTNGIYFLNIYRNDRVIKRERVVLNK